MSKKKVTTYIDDIVNSKKGLPAPSKYTSQYDWKKNQGGKFLKCNRITMSAEIIKRGCQTPGPGSFKPSAGKKIFGNYKYGEDRTSFIEQAQHTSKEIPGSKYDIKYVSCHLTPPSFCQSMILPRSS